MKSLKEQIVAILIDRNDSDDDPAELLYDLSRTARWDEFLAICEELLLDDANPRFWTHVASVFFRATGDGKDFSSVGIDRVIALLYHRHVDEFGIKDGNLIWSIVHVLKGVRYESEYEPFKDEGVWIELQKLKKGRPGPPPKGTP